MWDYVIILAVKLFLIKRMLWVNTEVWWLNKCKSAHYHEIFFLLLSLLAIMIFWHTLGHHSGSCINMLNTYGLNIRIKVNKNIALMQVIVDVLHFNYLVSVVNVNKCCLKTKNTTYYVCNKFSNRKLYFHFYFISLFLNIQFILTTL